MLSRRRSLVPLALLTAVLSGCASGGMRVRYWTSYTNPLDKTTDQHIKTDNYDCTREIQGGNAGQGHFSFGPLGWVIVDQAMANASAERAARNMIGLCMESKGWRELDPDDMQSMLKRAQEHPWTNYPEPLDTTMISSCVRDAARNEKPGKPLRVSWDRYTACLTVHGYREVADRQEFERIRALRQQQQATATTETR